LAESKIREVKLSFEHDEFGWFSFVDATEKLKKNKNNWEVLKKANEFLMCE
jgi:hypothetical protein